MAEVPRISFHFHRELDTETFCTISQCKISELAEEKFSVGLPHVVTYIEDVKGGEHLFDAVVLKEHFQRNGYKNPNTCATVAKVMHYAAKNWNSGYQKVGPSTFTIFPRTGQELDEIYFAQSLIAATDEDDSLFYVPCCSVIFDYLEKNDLESANYWKMMLFKRVEKIYDRGVALAILPYLVAFDDHTYLHLSAWLNQDLNMGRWKGHFEGTALDEYVKSNEEDLFSKVEFDRLVQEILSLHSNWEVFPAERFILKWSYSCCSQTEEQTVLEEGKQLLNRYPNDWMLLNTLGAFAKDNGSVQEAVALFNQRLVVESSDFYALINLILCHKSLETASVTDDVRDSLRLIVKSAEEISPYHPMVACAKVYYGNLIGIDCDADEILKNLEITMEYYRFSASLNYILGLTLCKVEGSGSEEAIYRFRQSVRLGDERVKYVLSCALLSRAFNTGSFALFIEANNLMDECISKDIEIKKCLKRAAAIASIEIPTFAEHDRFRIGLGYYRKLITDYPNLKDVQVYAAEAMSRSVSLDDRNEAERLLGEIGEVSVALDEVVKLTKFRIALRAGNLEEAEALRHSPAPDSHHYSSQLILEGLLCLMSPNPITQQEGVSKLETIAEITPHFGQVYRLLAYAYRTGLGVERDPQRASNIEEIMPPIPSGQESYVNYIEINKPVEGLAMKRQKV